MRRLATPASLSSATDMTSYALPLPKLNPVPGSLDCPRKGRGTFSVGPLLVLALMALTGCSSNTISTPPSSEEAQAAINAEPIGMSVVGHKAPTLYVTDVKLGTCTSSATVQQIVCDTAFTWEGNAVKTRVAYWPTSNPRHPWRAQFIPSRKAGR